jgi:hypothetical protein
MPDLIEKTSGAHLMNIASHKGAAKLGGIPGQGEVWGGDF